MMVCTAGDPFHARRKDRMNIYRIEKEEGGVWDAQRRLVNGDKAVRCPVEGVWESGER